MPTTDPEVRRRIRRDYERRNPGRRSSTRNSARSTRRESHDIKFIGVDGEGVDRSDGAHEYNLLSVGTQSLHHPDGSRLTTTEIFSFLWRQSRESPDAAYVGFFLGYDFSQWLQDLPEERARMLLTAAGQKARRRNPANGNPVPFPVRWHGWEFDLLPNMKRFKLRPDCACNAEWCKHPRQPWLYICDAGPLYQTSLLSAINPDTWPEPVCSDAEYETIKAGKEARSDNLISRGTPVDQTTISYNLLENEVLSRLMERTNQGLVGMGIRLRRDQWYGPGQAAQAWLKAVARRHDGATCRAAVRVMHDGELEPVPADGGPHDAARRSYFGGWFELMGHGLVPGETWEYDINSAYPFIIASLPCLLHGAWAHDTHGHYPGEWLETGRAPKYSLARAKVKGNDRFIGAMLHRTPQGSVHRPSQTSGWYWHHELRAAFRAGLISSVDYQESWTYEPCGCSPPFEAIRDLYTHRIAVGKQTPQGRAMRLVYNSAYGKLAQSIGEPLFGNAVYASLITAGCRTMILDAIASHPARSEAVVMIATDGIYFRSPHPFLDVDSQRLGAWDMAVKHNLSMFKPGVYWDDKTRQVLEAGDTPSFKARGINAKAFAKHIPEIDRMWSKFMPSQDPKAWPSLSVDYDFDVTTPKQAINRGKWELCGKVSHGGHTKQSSAPHNKRWGPFRKDDGMCRSSPKRNEEWLASTPYDKRFGLELEMHQEEMPILPEGEAAMLIAELLGMHDVHR